MAALVEDGDKNVETLKQRPEILEENVPERNRIPLCEKYHALGHFGASKIVYHLKGQGLFWKGMHVDAMKVTSGCRACQRYNMVRLGFHPLRPINVLWPGCHWSIDLWKPGVASTRGSRAVLTMVDRATGFVILNPVKDETALEVARALFTTWCLVGFPRYVTSDNGPAFTAEAIREMKGLAGMKSIYITAWHPAANGQCERPHRDIKAIMVKELEAETEAWEEALPRIMLTLNLKVSRRHRATPFALFMARGPNLFIDHRSGSKTMEPMSTESMKSRLLEMEKIVWPAMGETAAKYNKKMAADFSKAKKPTNQVVSPGEWVMTRVQGEKEKLTNNWEGPFQVQARTTNGSYILKGLDGKERPRAYAPDQLKKIPASSVPEGTKDIFGALRIMAHKGSGAERKYLVHWKGYKHKDDTWEPKENILDLALIEDYWSRKRKAARTQAQRARAANELNRTSLAIMAKTREFVKGEPRRTRTDYGFTEPIRTLPTYRREGLENLVPTPGRVLCGKRDWSVT